MSDVENFYYAIQAKIGGNFQWSELDPMQQMQFVQAINVILQITGGKK